MIKKENTNRKELDDSTEVVRDFRLQRPYASYRPMAYKISDGYLDLIPLIDAFLEKLFMGQIDEGNGDALDNLIFDGAHGAIVDLNAQRVRHEDTIRDFEVEAGAVEKSFRDHYEMVQEKHDELLELLNDIKQRIKKDKWR